MENILFRIGIFQRNILTRKDSSLFFRFFTMLNHRFDECPWISSSQNKTYFTNISMNNICHVLLQVVCVDGQSVYITMLYQKFCSLSGLRIVECTIGVHTFSTIFQQHMSKNVDHTLMFVIPNERNDFPVHMFERIFHDGSSIGTFEIVFCRPSTKIIITITHFEFLLLPCFL